MKMQHENSDLANVLRCEQFAKWAHNEKQCRLSLTGKSSRSRRLATETTASTSLPF